MFDLQTLDDLPLLAESVDLECKPAQGQDGRGEVPKDPGKFCTLFNNIETGMKSSPISSPKTGEKILQQLRENPQCSTQQLGDALGISKRAVLKQIEKLKQQGRLARIGSAKGGHWQVLEQ